MYLSIKNIPPKTGFISFYIKFGIQTAKNGVYI